MTSDQSYRAAYISALGLPKKRSRSSSEVEAGDGGLNPLKAALARAHELRKFEIENYWKRANYFWAFQLAAFALLGLVWKAPEAMKSLDRLVLLVPAGLGAISAQVGWMTAKGSKFWQENWEAHVDMLEQEVEGRMTQVIMSKTGPQYSVSAANQNFMLLLWVCWAAAFLAISFPAVGIWAKEAAKPLAIGTLGVATIFLIVWSKTDLKGWRFQRTQSEWSPYKSVSEKRFISSFLWNRWIQIAPAEHEIVLRDTFDQRAEKPKGTK